MRHQDYLEVAASRDKPTFEQRLLRSAQGMDFGIVSAALAVDQPGEKPLFVMIGNTPQAFVEASRSFARLVNGQCGRDNAEVHALRRAQQALLEGRFVS